MADEDPRTPAEVEIESAPCPRAGLYGWKHGRTPNASGGALACPGERTARNTSAAAVVAFSLAFFVILRTLPAEPSESEIARRLLAGHTGEVLALAFAPDSRLLASGGDDQAIRLWEPSTGREPTLLRGYAGPVRSIAFSPSGRLLASGSSDTTDNRE
jgi:hypothetical protein